MTKRQSALIAPLCITGAAGIGYGMLRDNDLVFAFGIIIAVAGYFLIRENLKDSVRDKH